MVCALLFGCCRKKCGHVVAGRQKDEVRLVPLTDASFVRQMESWMVTTRPRRREPLWPVTDETMRNWLKQAVKRAEADGVHFFDPRDAAYFPSQLYYAHALSPAAQEGHPGTGRA